MIHVADQWAVPWLAFLAGWSVRWGVVVAALAAWLAVRPPARAVVRHLLCLAALGVGMLLPVAPRWGNAVIPWPTRSATASPPEIAPPAPREFAGERLAFSPIDGPDVSRAEPLKEYARPRHPQRTAPPLGFRRLAALVTAGAWGATVLILLARLAFGWRALSRLRRGARDLEGGAYRLLDECRAESGLSRPVGLAAHSGVASPVVVGGFRPVVLVPADWGDWPDSSRRACLFHELAHLARYDDWARFAQEVLRAGFFFHPGVAWLLNRLDREREILCDEAAVRLGSDPISYARLLFDLARRPGRLSPVTPSSSLGWLPFLDRRTVEVRIDRLLEKDMRTTLSRPSVGRLLLTGAFAVASALAIGGLRVRAGVDAPPGPPKPAKAVTPAVVKASPRELQGVVIGPDDQPIPRATIVAGSTDAGRSGHEVLTTDDEGLFTWHFPDEANQFSIVAHKDGYTASTTMASTYSSVNRDNLKLRLAVPEPFVATLVDGKGKVLAGAKVRVEMMASGSYVKQGDRTTTTVGYEHIVHEVVKGSPVESLYETKTDADGEFAFYAIRPGVGLKLRITTADGRMMGIEERTHINDPLRFNMERSGFATAPPDELTRLVVIPKARIAGQVKTKLPGVTVAGMTVSYQDSHEPGVSRPATNFGAEVKTDADGRFVFDGLAEGTVNVFVHGPGENKDWTYRAAKDVSLKPGETAEVTIELIRGVEVEGKVVTQGTGAPLKDAQLGVYGPFRPRTGAMTIGAMTDARGQYRYRLPSGETYFYVMGPPKGFTSLPDKKSTQTVTIPDGVTTFEVPPIEIAPAVTVHGRVLDAQGKPVVGAKVVGICEGGVCRPFPGTETVTDASGEFRLKPGLNNTVAIGKLATVLVRLPGGVEHEVDALTAADGMVTLKLLADKK